MITSRYHICIGDTSNDGGPTACKVSNTRAMENVDCRDRPIFDHKERDMHIDQDSAGCDNFAEFFENNSDDDTISIHLKKV